MIEDLKPLVVLDYALGLSLTSAFAALVGYGLLCVGLAPAVCALIAAALVATGPKCVGFDR